MFVLLFFRSSCAQTLCLVTGFSQESMTYHVWAYVVTIFVKRRKIASKSLSKHSLKELHVVQSSYRTLKCCFNQTALKCCPVPCMEVCGALASYKLITMTCKRLLCLHRTDSKRRQMDPIRYGFCLQGTVLEPVRNGFKQIQNWTC